MCAVSLAEDREVSLLPAQDGLGESVAADGRRRRTSPPVESRLVSTGNREESTIGEQATEDAIRLTLTVPAPAERTFTVFVEGFASWDLNEYTWSQDVLDTIAIEGREGGRCFERGPEDFWIDWGRVLVWDPPRRLLFSWQISPRREPVPDREKASEVELRFEEEGLRSTRIEFEHRGFSRTARAPTATGRRSARSRAGPTSSNATSTRSAEAALRQGVQVGEQHLLQGQRPPRRAAGRVPFQLEGLQLPGIAEGVEPKKLRWRGRVRRLVQPRSLSLRWSVPTSSGLLRANSTASSNSSRPTSSRSSSEKHPPTARVPRRARARRWGRAWPRRSSRLVCARSIQRTAAQHRSGLAPELFGLIHDLLSHPLYVLLAGRKYLRLLLGGCGQLVGAGLRIAPQAACMVRPTSHKRSCSSRVTWVWMPFGLPKT